MRTQKIRTMTASDELWERLTEHAARVALRDRKPVSRCALIRRFILEGLAREAPSFEPRKER